MFCDHGSIGRCENQARLIDAFALLCKKQKEDLRLYIIGGGPLRNKLRKQITKLKLTGKVILTGNISNPFALLADCDCFVLPSLRRSAHGIVEARTLHLPIIVSDFSSVKDSLYPNGQLCIGMETEDILNALQAFLDGKVPNDYTFDPDQYNREAMAEFEVCLED